jgi:predicted ATP-binding protein involved in virulence
MHLLFIWVEDFRNIRQQGFNFNSKYNIAYNKKSDILTINDNPNYIRNFFGEKITDITAIVGENAVGKTSVLDFIKDKLSVEPSFRHKLILVYENKEGICSIGLMNTDTERVEVVNNSSKILKVNKYDLKSNIEETDHINIKNRITYSFGARSIKKNTAPSLIEQLHDFDETAIVFYSNIYDYKSEEQSESVFNVSTNFLVNSHAHNFRLKEIESQVYLLTANNIVSDLGIDLPDTIAVSLNRKHLHPRNSHLYRGKAEEIQSAFNKYQSDIRVLFVHDSPNNKLRFRISVSLLINFLSEFSQSLHVNDVLAFLKDEMQALSSSIDLDPFEYYKDALRRFNNFFSYIQVAEPQLLNVSTENIVFVLEYLSRPELQFKKSNIDNCYFEIKVDKDDNQHVMSFLEHYSKSFTSRNVLNFEWHDMSSGAKSRLAFLARLFALSNNSTFQKKCDNGNVLLLVDEGEQYFHPQWQKEYISFLTRKAPLVLRCKSLQIILTSHSPFVLSDLFKENVIYLTRNPKTKRAEVADNEIMENTFAANIHTLFTNAFFMRDGLLGQFAQDKIDEILSPLFNDVLNESQIMNMKIMINNIGEPVLRKRLANMLLSKINK